MGRIGLSGLVGICLMLGGSSCRAGEAEPARVLTTFLPVYCLTTAVAGDAARVENLLPEHVGPHDYLLTPRDLRRAAAADLIVINGLGIEANLVRRMQSALGDRLPPIVVMAAGLGDELIHEVTPVAGTGGQDESGLQSQEHRHDPTHRHGDADPHIWLDPRLAAHAVTNILRGLQRMDPEQAPRYAANAQQYIGRLERLDAELEEGLKDLREVPFVTYHDAFPYFVRRYGLNLIGVVEQVPDVNPSPRYLQSLNEAIRERGAKVIFTEPQFSSRMVRQIARDLGVSLEVLDPLETGALKPEAYEEGMRRILKTLREHLK
jgi:zinc/manganese transport system substrate-binding protein